MNGFDIAVALALLLLAAYEAALAFLLWRTARERGRPLRRERSMWLRAVLSVVLASAAVGALFSLSGNYIVVLSRGTEIAFVALLLFFLLDIARGILRSISRRGRDLTSQTPIEADTVSQVPTLDQAAPGPDPGWRDALPIVGPIRLARRGDTLATRPLIGLRLMFVGVAGSPLLFLVPSLSSRRGRDGSGSRCGCPRSSSSKGSRPSSSSSDCATDPCDRTARRPLATEYRSAMFTGIGLAESAVLVAFIMVFIANSLWPYLVGLAFSLMGLALVAPTARDIKRRQEQLKTADAQISLLQALDTPTLGRPV